MGIPVLRDYQEEHERAVRLAHGDGIQRLIVVMPTGTGKTTVFAKFTNDWLLDGHRVLLVVHRIELLQQTYDRLLEFGIRAGVIAGGTELDETFFVQGAMVQSLSELGGWVPDFIIVDECHHATAKSYARLWSLFPKAKILGFTATPVRLDGKTFEGLFERMIYLYPDSWYVKHGALLPVKHFVCTYTADRYAVIDQDYDLRAMSRVMRSEKRIADVVKSYQTYAPNRRAIVFAADLEHSQDIVRRFNEVGIRAAHLDGTMDKTTRAQIVEDFKRGIIKVISNFDIVTEGFDVPAVEAVILARLSRSLAFFIQAVGRCRRPVAGSDKTFGYVLDCCNMWLEHGVAGVDYAWRLQGNAPQPTIAGSRLFGINRVGRRVAFVKPVEDPGIELCQLVEHMGRLSAFEKYLEEALSHGEDPAVALDRYEDFLRFQGLEITKYEVRFCRTLLERAGVVNEDSFWKELLEVSI